eukprot:CAMPEP_0197526796 /NCGR_PEP_ID=MMETSP1318-20131121/19407_1 /TAXON_ID=552666 /ORGANISM="Partenskyella glossopodia, Strain RCC365" /LENGTH=414 /DNA_ID=CAMNT_0043081137 /DNA_START=30 /DNA_END=1274 /DNA_ORIENTATION=-
MSNDPGARTGLWLWALAWAAAAAVHVSGGSCVDGSGCLYNGECVQGSCQCYPAFRGSICGKFNFVASDGSLGRGLRSVDDRGLQVSSWGGSVLLGDDGRYHMWAAEMVNGTGIKAWITNSQVVHAVADDPSKPFHFTRQEVVWPVFAHEPTVSRAPTGEYVMFFTTNYGQKQIPCTGKSCFGFNGTSDPSCPNDQQCTLSPPEPLSTRMSYAKEPSGPWSEPVLVPSPGNVDTNLACAIAKNESILCVARPQIGMYSHTDWKDVLNYRRYMPDLSNIVPDKRMIGEDPMLWVDKTGVFHVVLHGGGWNAPFGYHYYSKDGYKWNGDNRVKVYENIVEQARDKPLNLSRRERPHVVFGKDGATPVAVSNGVTEAWPCTLVPKPVPGSNGTSILCPKDYCYTFVQPLAGWKENLWQ